MATRKERIVCSLLGAGANAWLGHNKAKSRNEPYTFEKLLTRVLVGAGSGLLFAEIFGEPNDTVNYTGYKKRSRVYEGIAYKDRINERVDEHLRNGKKFTRIVFDHPKPRSEARILEQEKIYQYRPKYNIQHNL